VVGAAVVLFVVCMLNLFLFSFSSFFSGYYPIIAELQQPTPGESLVNGLAHLPNVSQCLEAATLFFGGKESAFRINHPNYNQSLSREDENYNEDYAKGAIVPTYSSDLVQTGIESACGEAHTSVSGFGKYECNERGPSFGPQGCYLSSFMVVSTSKGAGSTTAQKMFYDNFGNLSRRIHYNMYAIDETGFELCSPLQQCLCAAQKKPCEDFNGISNNNKECLCGVQVCSLLTGYYCTAVENHCAIGPTCAIANGTAANEESCSCGTPGNAAENCEKDTTGLYCDANINKCGDFLMRPADKPMEVACPTNLWADGGDYILGSPGCMMYGLWYKGESNVELNPEAFLVTSVNQCESKGNVFYFWGQWVNIVCSIGFSDIFLFSVLVQISTQLETQT